MAKGPVLFICVENAGRSQMAEAFARKHGLNAQSAGTIPSSKINPIVVQAMHERNIDISNNHPKTLTPEMIEQARPCRDHGLLHRRSVSETDHCSDAEEANRMASGRSKG